MAEHLLDFGGKEAGDSDFPSAEYIARYLHLVGQDDLFCADKFLYAFAEKSNDELFKIATTINLFAREVPLRIGEKKRTPAYRDWQRAFLDDHYGSFLKEVDETGRQVTTYYIVPPKQKVSKRMFGDTLSALKRTIESDDPEAANVVARTLYHAVYYLQPFPNANKRTARLLYYLFSPRVVKDEKTFSKDVENILSSMDDTLEQYDLELSKLVGRDMLVARGLPTEYDEKEKKFRVHLSSPKVRGFAFEFLCFFAVWDTLSPKKRERFKRLIPNSAAFYFDVNDLPDSISAPLLFRSTQVDFTQPAFEEFSCRVIELGLQTDPPFPQDLQQLLDEAF
ncbi:MAG: Fic family protein [Candidatus Uhrbacteria bacterium]|nr:Fic family protein [Candidatus Uhrbacteria bacterium]